MVPGKRLDFVKKEIDRLLSLNIIVPSDSPFASPIVLVKKGESFRMCIDYTQLNHFTYQVASPLPSITAILHDVAQFKFFTKLDLKNGYHQMALAQDPQDYSAFIALDQQFKFLRVPFGLTNAPFYFQNAMLRILGDLVPSISRVYIDDIVIFANTMSDLIFRTS